MEIKETNPKRKFNCGNNVTLTHVADIVLDNDELITFKSKENREYDFVCKEWGYYVTPSINKRLKINGYRAALMENKYGDNFIVIVEVDKIRLWENYNEEEEQIFVKWI